MSEIKDFLRDVGYFGVGAAATILEAGDKAVKALVKKGAETLHDNQDTVDEIVRKAQELGEKVKETVEKAVQSSSTPEAPEAADETDCPECACDDGCCPCGDDAAECPECADEAAADSPVVPDAVYRTEEPAAPESPEVPEEENKPEESVNG